VWSSQHFNILDTDSGGADDSSMLVCDLVSLGKQLPTFRRTAVPSSSGSSGPGLTHRHTLYDLGSSGKSLFGKFSTTIY
jgi:hypothetical protein